MRELTRREIITEDMLTSIEQGFESQARIYDGSSRAESFAHMAHMARVLPIEAAAPSPSEFQAEQRRARIRIVADGGKAQD